MTLIQKLAIAYAFLFFGVASLVFLSLAVLSSFATSAILRSLGRREAQR